MRRENYRQYRNRLYGISIRIIETGEIFETRTECAKALGVSPSMISMYFAGKVLSCGGYHLEIVEGVINHELTDDIIYELHQMTGFYSEWRMHPTRPNIYVSDYGLVAKNRRGRVEMLKQHVINSGYLVVSASDKGTKVSKNSNVLVHRLVAETFIENINPDDLIYVNHIDGCKYNNQANNLEWCNMSENMIHAYENGLYKTDWVRVKETGCLYPSLTACAKAINGTVSGIHDCKTGRQKQHRGYHFEFLGKDYWDLCEYIYNYGPESIYGYFDEYGNEVDPYEPYY